MTIEKLQDILNQLSGVLSKLLEASKAKQEVLINRDHENLNSLTNREQRLLAELNELSLQQKTLTESLKVEYELPVQLTSLTEILELISERISPQSRSTFQALLTEIKDNGEQLGLINDQNKLLIETSREFVKGIIQAVRGNDNKSLINRKM